MNSTNLSSKKSSKYTMRFVAIDSLFIYIWFHCKCWPIFWMEIGWKFGNFNQGMEARQRPWQITHSTQLYNTCVWSSPVGGWFFGRSESVWELNLIVSANKRLQPECCVIFVIIAFNPYLKLPNFHPKYWPTLAMKSNVNKQTVNCDKSQSVLGWVYDKFVVFIVKYFFLLIS
jgi:hypothetical protein